MKQRITYIVPEGTGISAGDIDVSSDRLHFAKASEAVQEWRFTLGLEELPVEIRDILQDTHELHVRWASERSVDLLPPLVSRLPAGFHAFFTPRDASKDVPLCNLIRSLLPGPATKCKSVPESFSKPPILSGRFASASTWQFFDPVPIGDRIGRRILGRVCRESMGVDYEALGLCEALLSVLPGAAYVDVDFDAIAHALTFTAVWGAAGGGAAELAARDLRKLREDDRLEVGTLQVEASTDPEELSLGGFLTVLGEDERPSPTMFSFPSRHHPLPPSLSGTHYTIHFQQPTGLHPKLDITFPGHHLAAPSESCALHAYLTLPSALFLDRYQLSDPLFLASQNLIALRSLSGEEDLEAPDWILERWGSAALLELATPNETSTSASPAASEDGEDWTVTIPTHLRYLAGPQRANDTSTHATLEVPWPTVFWACQADAGTKMSNNPFDRTNLGYDGLFGSRTMFYHVPPRTAKPAGAGSDGEVEGVRGRLVAEVKVPVLDESWAGIVRAGTGLVVLLGFAWVVWKMVKGSMIPADAAKTSSRQREGKKQQ